MPRNPNSGEFTFVPTSFTPALAGTTIESSANNTYLEDVRQAISTSIASTGVTQITADIPFNNYKITDIADAIAKDNAVPAHQIAEGTLSWCGLAGGTGDAITLTNSFISSYADGMVVNFKTTATNTTSVVTVDLNTLGTISVTINDGTPIEPGMFVAGRIYSMIYDADSNAFVYIKTTQSVPLPPSGTLSPGMLSYWISSSLIPEGWLLANGQTVSRSTYPDLWSYASISGNIVPVSSKSSYPLSFDVGNGTTTFGIPDGRGLFLRSLDLNRGFDVGRVNTSFQGDAIRNITGSYLGAYGMHFPGSGTGCLQVYEQAVSPPKSLASSAGTVGEEMRIDFSASSVVPIANENRPINSAVPLFIYVGTVVP